MPNIKSEDTEEATIDPSTAIMDSHVKVDNLLAQIASFNRERANEINKLHSDIAERDAKIAQMETGRAEFIAALAEKERRNDELAKELTIKKEKITEQRDFITSRAEFNLARDKQLKELKGEVKHLENENKIFVEDNRALKAELERTQDELKKGMEATQFAFRFFSGAGNSSRGENESSKRAPSTSPAGKRKGKKGKN
ncbi:hypothetical protein OQA88_10006 [Cercophora sp. LCS_1]